MVLFGNSDQLKMSISEAIKIDILCPEYATFCSILILLNNVCNYFVVSSWLLPTVNIAVSSAEVATMLLSKS